MVVLRLLGRMRDWIWPVMPSPQSSFMTSPILGTFNFVDSKMYDAKANQRFNLSTRQSKHNHLKYTQTRDSVAISSCAATAACKAFYVSVTTLQFTSQSVFDKYSFGRSGWTHYCSMAIHLLQLKSKHTTTTTTTWNGSRSNSSRHTQSRQQQQQQQQGGYVEAKYNWN